MTTHTTKVEIKGETSKYERSMRNVQRVNAKTTQMIQNQWLKAAGVIYGAMKAWDTMKLGARAEQERAAFGNIAASYGSNVDIILADLKRASAGTVDTMTLVNKAGTAMMMGIAPEKLSKLMGIARATAKMTGQSVTRSFQDISLAVGRQSKMILDNLGIIVQTGEANKEYAKILGKTATQLTDAEKKQAFLNATIGAGEELVERMGKQTKTTAEMFQSLEAMAKNSWEWVSKATVKVIGGIVIATTQGLKAIGIMLSTTTEGFIWLLKQMDKIPGVDFSPAINGLGAFNAKIEVGINKANKFTDELLALNQKAVVTARPIAIGGGGFVGGDQTGADQKALDEMHEWLYQKSLTHEQRMLASKTEYMQAWHVQQAEAIIGMKDWEHQAGYDHEMRMLALKEGVAGQEYQITKNLIEKQITLEKYRRDMSRAASYQMLGDYAFAFQEMGKHSQTAFEMFKAFSVAQTVIKTYEAAMGAFAAMAGIPIIGPALGAAAATAAVAAGMARVSAIMSTQPGTSTVSGGAVGTYPASPTTGLPVSTIGQTETKGAVHIHIEGDFIGDEAFVDRLVEKINDAADRDVFVN